MAKTKTELAREIIAALYNRVEPVPEGDPLWDSRIRKMVKKLNLGDLLQMHLHAEKILSENKAKAKSGEDYCYSSVWFTGTFRVRIREGTSTREALRRMNGCLWKAMQEEYGDQLKAAGVEGDAIEDPTSMIAENMGERV